MNRMVSMMMVIMMVMMMGYNNDDDNYTGHPNDDNDSDNIFLFTKVHLDEDALLPRLLR